MEFLKIFKKIFFQKVHYFWVWRLFVVDYCDFGELGVYMGLEFAFLLFVFCLRLNFGLFLVVSNVLKPSLCIVVTSPQPPQTLSLSQVTQENFILAYYAQIWKFSPRVPKMEFFKKIHFFEKVSRFRFQRALNHPQSLSLSQVMQENVIMPKYGNSAPGSQKWNFSKKLIVLKRSPDFASNEPSTTPRH